MEEEQICREIWTRWVPKRGQSTVLQGELLRQIERLRHEAQANGNRNWCRDHAFFCAFLDHTLLDSGVLSPEEGERLHGVLSTSAPAARWPTGTTGESSQSGSWRRTITGRPPGTDDAPYDLVRGAVVRFCQAHPAPIPYQPRPDIRH